MPRVTSSSGCVGSNASSPGVLGQGVWMQKMSVAIANEMAIGALRRTPLCTRQRVLGGMGESRDEGYESMSLGRQGAM